MNLERFLKIGLALVIAFNFQAEILRGQIRVFSSAPIKAQTSNISFDIYLPLIRTDVIEYDVPSCRWRPIYGSDEISIFYEWGNNLQSPGNPWRVAFEAGISDWNTTLTKVTFYYHSFEDVLVNTYNLNDGFAGYAVPHCDGTITTYYEVFGNENYSQSTNARHAIAGHEIGHSQSIGHIDDPRIALMGYNPNNEIYFVPQPLDISLVNQIYP